MSKNIQNNIKKITSIDGDGFLQYHGKYDGRAFNISNYIVDN